MWLIREKILRMIMEASKDTYPREFGALLKAEGGVIYEIAIIPGTIQGDRHTMFWMYMKPVDFSIVGSVHSHPNGVTLPSDQDLQMFSNNGPIHIIVGHPYNLHNFNAYDRAGNPVEIKVV
ncbi:MAG: Mov34/MPN/PAD-1 family protein [Candidatus Thermoplasmatota archaeon]|jgi:proteasome lid subunit RPN8/RPN11|nr:Mov34/MPN/PAD-1 family protein [Candidatus Thermoplasmatota archaeon]MCL5794155.1 Mov34/MPN/PAD-1 family protein [Candidatus Thermoplasmatota archaeon]